jgi:hypothetical protein
MAVKMIDELWTNQKKIENKNDKNWAKIRIKKDNNEPCLDWLIGSKGIQNHVHFGMYLNQERAFIYPRGELLNINLKVESNKRGLLSDETEIFQEAKGNIAELTVIMTIESTGELKVKSMNWTK